MANGDFDTFSPEEAVMPIQEGAPYFMGDNALIRFSDNSNYWLVDKSKQTIRPFESEAALKQAFGPGTNEALQSATTIASPPVDENNEITEGVLQGFTVLDADYSIGNDGVSKESGFSPAQLKRRYGKPIDENKENMAMQAIESTFNKLQADPNIPRGYIDQIKRDSQLMAFYISALAYGDYTLSDIYSDILKRSQE